MEFFNQLVNAFTFIVDFIVHVDVHLSDLLQQFGPWLYLILFGIVFCETGLVVMPLLPGDSLLFAAGALTAIDGSPLSVNVLIPLMIAAALAGDVINYAIGRRLGPAVFNRADSIFLSQKHLHRAQEFYEKHGARMIIIARFVAIVRTFAPFVAGIAKMNPRRYITFCVAGATLWVSAFVVMGSVFGNLPLIRRNFHVVVLAIIFVSVLPLLKEFIATRQSRTLANAGAPTRTRTSA